MNQSLTLAIIDLIEEQLPTIISIDAIAQHCGYSRSYIQRHFKTETGYSISSYQRMRNVSLAAMRLAEGKLRILDIAIEHGFESQEAFARAFRQQTSTTPSNLFGHKTWAERVNFERIDSKKLEQIQRCLALPIEVIEHPATRWGCFAFTVNTSLRQIDVIIEAISNAHHQLAKQEYSRSLRFEQMRILEFREHSQNANSTYPMSLAFPFLPSEPIPNDLLEVQLPACKMAQVILPDPSYVPMIFHHFYHRVFEEKECYLGGWPALWHYDEQTGELHFGCPIEPIKNIEQDPLWDLIDKQNIVDIDVNINIDYQHTIAKTKRAGTRRISTLLQQLCTAQPVIESIDLAFHAPSITPDSQYHYSFIPTYSTDKLEAKHVKGLFLSTYWNGECAMQLENQLEKFYLRLAQHSKYQYRASPELIRNLRYNGESIEFNLLTPVEKRALSRQKSIWTVEQG